MPFYWMCNGSAVAARADVFMGTCEKQSIGPRVHHGTHAQIFLAVKFHIVMIFSHLQPA